MPLLHTLAMCVHHWQARSEDPAAPLAANWHALPAEQRSQLIDMLRSDMCAAGRAPLGALISLQALASDAGPLAATLAADVRETARHVLCLVSAFLAAQGGAYAEPTHRAASCEPLPPTAERAAVASKKAAALSALQAQQAAFLDALQEESSEDDAAPSASAPAHATGAVEGGAAATHEDVAGHGPSAAGGEGVAQCCRFFPAAHGEDVCCLCHEHGSPQAPLADCALVSLSGTLHMR